MFSLLSLPLAALITWLVWQALSRSRFMPGTRALLTILTAILSMVLLFWGGVYLSIFLFQAGEAPGM